MKKTQALNLYRRGKYPHLLTGRSGYLLSFIPSKDAVWFRTPKVGSRSIDAMLSEHFSDYLYSGHECAIPERKLDGLFCFCQKPRESNGELAPKQGDQYE